LFQKGDIQYDSILGAGVGDGVGEGVGFGVGFGAASEQQTSTKY